MAKASDRSPTKSVIGFPQSTGPDCRGADSDGNWAGKNIGSGAAQEVRDRVPRAPLMPDRAAMEQGRRGKGLNPRSMNESAREYLNQGPELDGQTDGDGEFDGE